MEQEKALQIFNFQDQELRTTIVDGESWWLASDVCKILDHSDVSMAVSRLDEDEKLIQTLLVSGQHRNVITVNESGLYHLIFTSRKEQAQQFRKWVTGEVLPAIRKTGSYSLSDRLDYAALQKELDGMRGTEKEFLSRPAPFHMVKRLRDEMAQQQKEIRELQEYINNREVQQSETLQVVGPERDVLLATQDSPLLRAIRELIDQTGGSWEGLLMELRREMTKYNLDLDGIPTGLPHLSRHLKRIVPLARYQGIELKLCTRTKHGRPVRIRMMKAR